MLSYEYVKYKIKSSYDIGRKFELYLQMKEERKHVLMMTANLNDAENKLLMLLKRIGISDHSCMAFTDQRTIYTQ